MKKNVNKNKWNYKVNKEQTHTAMIHYYYYYYFICVQKRLCACAKIYWFGWLIDTIMYRSPLYFLLFWRLDSNEETEATDQLIHRAFPATIV